MSSGTSGGNTLNWYKLFSGIFSLAYALFIWQLSLCFAKPIDPASRISVGTLSCLLFGLLALGTLVAGMLPTLLGLEHAKKLGRKGMFFRMIILIYVLGIVAIIGTIVLT